MAAPRTVWGIDVGQFALRGVKLRLIESGAEVLAFDVVEYPQILSQPEVNADQLLAEAVDKFIGRNDLRNAEVVLGVPGQQTFTRFSKLPPVEPKKIGNIVKYEAQQQIPFDIDEVIWDYQVFSSPDTPEVEVGIFAIRRDLVRRYLSVFLDRGIEPTIVQASPLGLYNYLAFDEMPENGAVVILDVGAQNTDLVVARRDSTWVRNIPLGGNSFTEALIKSFKLSFAKAESLKRTAATSRYARQIFQAMRPVFAELVAEIQRSLGYYSSTHRDAQLGRIVGMGNAFKLPGLQKYLQQNLQMEVDRLGSFKKLQLAPGVNAQVFNENVASLGVAYGLAVQGAGAGRINNSLLPGEIARTVIWRRKRPWFAAAAAMILVAAGAMWYSQARYAAVLAAGSVGTVAAPVTPEEAQKVILGQSAVLVGISSPRARAEVVLKSAQVLQGALQQAQATAGGGDEVQGLVNLYKDRGVWLELIRTIHDALPKPWPELAAAKTDEQYVAAMKNLPRNQRPLVFIDSMDSVFVADVNAAFDAGGAQAFASRGGGLVDEGIGAPTESAAQKGFLVIMRGRTPYGENLGSAVKYLTDDLIEPLKKIRGQEVAFYVGKIDTHPNVLPVSQAQTANLLAAEWTPPEQPLKNRSARGPLSGGFVAPPQYGGYDGGRGGGRGEDPMRGGGRGEDPDRARAGGGYGSFTPSFTYTGSIGTATGAMADPLLEGETQLNDYAFMVRFTVVLGQPPEAPTEPPAETEASQPPVASR